MEMRRDYLYVRLSGAFSAVETMTFYLEAKKEADLRKNSRVLIDCLQVTGSPSTAERYQLGALVAQEMRDSVSWRRATAVVATEPLLDKGRLIELVATNRGAKFKAFDRISDALRWLGSEKQGVDSTDP